MLRPTGRVTVESDGIHRDFLSLEGPGGAQRQVHYRRAGSGPPLLLLHPSPLSSAALEPLMRQLAPLAAVIAPDTPGYGFSDPLPGTPQNIGDYARALKEFADALQLRSVGLYGSATGAQIAIEFARLFPESADFLVLENAAHFEDAERDRILEHYFPSMQPRADGGHLLTAWQMARDMFQFFPWFEHSAEARVDAPLSLDAVHATALAQLQAGEDYHLAYRAAFLNEDFSHIARIDCPVRILRREGGLLQRYDRKPEHIQWPQHVQMQQCGSEPEQRFEALCGIVRELRDDSRSAPPPQQRPGANQYARMDGAQFRLRTAGDGREKTLLYLHDAGAGAEEFDALMTQHAADGPCRQVAPDLPGHGLSDPLHGEYALPALADWLLQLMQTLELPPGAVHASGLGAVIARECRRRRPECITDIHVHGDAPAEWNDELAPDLSPRWDGTHLLQAWYMLRDSCLYRPWNRRDAAHRRADFQMPAPAQLTRRLLRLFRAGEVYAQALRLCCDHFDRGESP